MLVVRIASISEPFHCALFPYFEMYLAHFYIHASTVYCDSRDCRSMSSILFAFGCICNTSTLASRMFTLISFSHYT